MGLAVAPGVRVAWMGFRELGGMLCAMRGFFENEEYCV